MTILPVGGRNRHWEPGAARLEAIADVYLESAPWCRQRMRRFYGDLVGLRERPGEVDVSGDLCFSSGLLRLRVRVTADALGSPNRRRALVCVPSLGKITELLMAEGLICEMLQGMAFHDRRVSVLDPAGNRIELKEEWYL